MIEKKIEKIKDKMCKKNRYKIVKIGFCSYVITHTPYIFDSYAKAKYKFNQHFKNC